MSENKALRYNSGKTEWTLVDFDALEPMVKVLMFGAQKYAPHNWKKGLTYTTLIDCSLRHLLAIAKGEDIDPESGESHIGHLMCNAMFLSWMMKNKPEFDNRPKPQTENHEI